MLAISHPIISLLRPVFLVPGPWGSSRKVNTRLFVQTVPTLTQMSDYWLVVNLRLMSSLADVARRG